VSACLAGNVLQADQQEAAIDAAANESSPSSSWSGAAGSGTVTTTYAYDAENRLTALATGGQAIGSYSYDGSGDRYAKTTAAATTSYTLDLASSLPQVLSETTGGATAAYAYAGGALELDRSGSSYWYLVDTLGSVRMLTDVNGDSPATYNYSAFGSTRASTGSIANEVRFTGERTDTESGLEFLRARTYDPATGTFLQRDTWGISPTDSQSLGLYLYTENDPVNATDPSGHKSCPVGSADQMCDRYGSMPNSFQEARIEKVEQEAAAKKAYDSQAHCRVVGMAGSRCDAPVNFHVQSKSWSWPMGDDYRSVGPAALTLTHDWTELKVTVSTEAGDRRHWWTRGHFWTWR